MTKVLPIENRVLIKPTDPETKSKGGLLIKKIDDDRQDQGVVEAVGDGEEVKNRFKKGDVLIYLKYGPQEITIDKEKYVIAHLDEILGKVEK